MYFKLGVKKRLPLPNAVFGTSSAQGSFSKSSNLNSASVNLQIENKHHQVIYPRGAPTFQEKCHCRLAAPR